MSTPPPLRLDRLRVLAVDDDADSREVLAVVLEELGATVMLAESVASAMRVFRANPINVVIADIAMPEQDGFDLLRQLRALIQGEQRAVFTVAVSAYIDARYQRDLLTAGFDAFVSKPIDFPALTLLLAARVHADAPPPQRESSS